jgi:pectate lyase
MRKSIVLFFVVLAAILWADSLMAQTDKIPAFPGAEGFGRFSTGGRGGDVYHVTNLNDSGSGSLRNGIETAQGPRTIVFDLSGNIMAKSVLNINKPNITIAGQTAPGDGITLGGGCLKISSDNIIIRYIRARLGDQSGGANDAVTIARGSNIILDHLSASWSVDETLSDQGNEIDLVTVQWCMITESLNNSNHNKGAHGYGGIVGGLRQSFHHNLYAHHASRNPKVTGRRHCDVDFRNNVIYNWGHNSCYDGTASWVNWVNNYYKAGPATKGSIRGRIFELSDKEIEAGGVNSPDDSKKYETSFFVEGNYVDGFPVITANNWKGGIDYMGNASEAKNRALKPFDFPPITEQTAEKMYPLVLKNAGASLERDVIDQRIIKEVKTGTVTFGKNGIIDSQKDVGGWPVLKSLAPLTDTDQDGMPDTWEKQNNLNPNDPADRNGDLNKDGYTNLEEYLNSIIISKSIK